MMNCPNCSRALIKTEFKSFVCPDGHGALVTPRQLRYKDTEVIESTDLGRPEMVAPQRAHRIACPHCTKEMFIVNYSNSGILIDSCMDCHYRWIDAGELHKIKAYKPKLDAVDMATLSQLDKRMLKLEDSGNFNHNPAYRLPSKVGPVAIAHAFYYGMKHSWFTRVVTIGILIGVAFAYSAVIDYFQNNAR